MIQQEDDLRIEALKTKLGIEKKVDVVRAGIELLEKEVARRERVQGWKRATALVVASSRQVNNDFRKHSRLKRI